ncbi:MAG: hypothetical protein U5N26_01045 [Candidatus Marinimicrobia bacterium]|nr:hypothetical protein [Candidatus Neomarinimicrobiota bacterium]
MLESAFLGEMHFMEAVEKIIKRLDAIPVSKRRSPSQSGHFGATVYVRDNEVINQDLIQLRWKNAGGEVLTISLRDGTGNPVNDIVVPYLKYAKG